MGSGGLLVFFGTDDTVEGGGPEESVVKGFIFVLVAFVRNVRDGVVQDVRSVLRVVRFFVSLHAAANIDWSRDELGEDVGRVGVVQFQRGARTDSNLGRHRVFGRGAAALGQLRVKAVNSRGLFLFTLGLVVLPCVAIFL